MRTVDIEMVEEGARVARHRVARVRLGVVRLLGQPVAAGVEGDGAKALVDERVEDP